MASTVVIEKNAETSSESQSFLLDEIGCAVMVVGCDGIIRYANQHVCGDVGKPMSEIVGSNYRQVFWPEFISYYDSIQTECMNRRKFTGIYYWGEMALWEQISARYIRWDSRPSILLTITNVSEVTCSEYSFENSAFFDGVLKLPNGVKLEEDISILADVEAVTLLYVRIRRFKDVNELYGWDNGDALLKQVRDWLLISEPHRAQLYRVNNGFVLFARQVTITDALDRAKEIQRRFTVPWVLSTGGGSFPLFLSVNCGIIHGKYVKNEMRNLLMRTIRAAEKSGSGLAVYDAEEDHKAKKEVIVRDSFINCLFNGMKGFSVCYQPIVRVDDRRWVGVEALCRWTAPNAETIPPLHFIRTAEQMNLIDHLDAWVRKTALEQCIGLGSEHSFTLHVNFSPKQKFDDSFIAELLRTMDETRFPPARINVEITESARMLFDKTSLDTLSRLKKIGIRLSLDDFGTGYSTMENLIKLSTNTIKLDRVFFTEIEKDSYRQYLINLLVNLAHHLGMSLIAEGVETEEEFAVARTLGVDYVQGYLFSRPLTFEQLRNESWRLLQ